MYERSGGSMSIEERLANRGATTHAEPGRWAGAEAPRRPSGRAARFAVVSGPIWVGSR